MIIAFSPVIRKKIRDRVLKSMQGIKMRLGRVDISSQFFSFGGQSTCFEFSLGDTVLWEQRTSPSHG